MRTLVYTIVAIAACFVIPATFYALRHPPPTPHDPHDDLPPHPAYPFPDDHASPGDMACMNGITMVRRSDGWTTLYGSPQQPMCAVQH